MTQTWRPDSYAHNARFVSDLGAPVVALLAPQPGERILDLGCGDGALTEALAAAGARVVGVDSSAEMVAGARARGLDARVADATALPFEAEFDAVFTNAVLHWVPDIRACATGVARALKPGGRFVGEFGGFGNVAAIATALRAVLARHGAPGALTWSPWYYPTPEEFSAVLAGAGFEVETAALIPRPTPLPTGMAGWISTFAQPFLARLPEPARSKAIAETVDLLAGSLCDTAGRWTADYVRLRFRALSR